MVQQHEQNTQQEVTTVVADSHYGTKAENYRQGAGIQDQQTHLKSYQAASTGLYPANRFIYEAHADRFRCVPKATIFITTISRRPSN